MNATIPIVYAIATLAYGAARSKEPAATKAGVLVVEKGVGISAIVREISVPLGIAVHEIRMSQLDDNVPTVREVRTGVEKALEPGKPVIFLLDEAQASDGEMLMRVTRIIDTANVATQAVVLAVGCAGTKPDQLAMDVADGMRTSRDRIMGSSTFMDALEEIFDRA